MVRNGFQFILIISLCIYKYIKYCSNIGRYANAEFLLFSDALAQWWERQKKFAGNEARRVRIFLGHNFFLRLSVFYNLKLVHLIFNKMLNMKNNRLVCVFKTN